MNEQISNFLQECIDANDFPSAVYLVAEKGEIVFQDALGYAVVEPARIEARIDTIYDLASLTKPLVTGLLAAAQIEDGALANLAGTRLGDEEVAEGLDGLGLELLDELGGAGLEDALMEGGVGLGGLAGAADLGSVRHGRVGGGAGDPLARGGAGAPLRPAAARGGCAGSGSPFG